MGSDQRQRDHPLHSCVVNMKKLALALTLLATPAFAQQQPQTVEDLQAEYLFETGQLRQALGQAQAQIIQLRKENADLKAKGGQKPEAKK